MAIYFRPRPKRGRYFIVYAYHNFSTHKTFSKNTLKIP